MNMRHKLVVLVVTAMLSLGTGGAVAATITDTPTDTTAEETPSETAPPEDRTVDTGPGDSFVEHDGGAAERHVERGQSWKPDDTTAERDESAAGTIGDVHLDGVPENATVLENGPRVTVDPNDIDLDDPAENITVVEVGETVLVGPGSIDPDDLRESYAAAMEGTGA